MHTGSCVDEKTVGRRPVRIHARSHGHTHGSTRGMLSSHLRLVVATPSIWTRHPLLPAGSNNPSRVWMWSHSGPGGGNRQRQTPLYALLVFLRTVPAHKCLARKPGTGRISAARHLLTTISFYYSTALNCWRCSSSSASCMLLREIR
jgi:hypothetical protein